MVLTGMVVHQPLKTSSLRSSRLSRSLCLLLACFTPILIHQWQCIRTDSLAKSLLLRQSAALRKDIDSQAAKTTSHSRTERVEYPAIKVTNFSGIIARPFLKRTEPLQCFPADPHWNLLETLNKPSRSGILYAKPYKTGSSTCASITIRLARNLALASNRTDVCRSRFDHGDWERPAYKLFGKRDRKKSFLWTSLREPTKRIISLFFFDSVSRRKGEPSDLNFLNYVTNEGSKGHAWNYYIESLSLRENVDDPVKVANEMLQDYDFIAITERLDESVVAMKMILNVPLAHMLFLSAKTQGGYDDGGGKTKQCVYIVPSFVSPGMKQFFSSKDWRKLVQYDLALYQAANASLDLTIERLGREKFELELAKFRHAQKVVTERCEPNAVFPCNADGKKMAMSETDCLWLDSGCAFDCLDQVSTELGLWNA